VLAVAGVVPFAVQCLKGHAMADAARFAAVRGAISAAVFTLAGCVRYRRSPACMLPRPRRG
jgi:hypothetical protein